MVPNCPSNFYHFFYCNQWLRSEQVSVMSSPPPKYVWVAKFFIDNSTNWQQPKPATEPHHLFCLISKCHSGMLDLCNKWPCTLHRFSIAVHYWCCIVRRISLDGKQRHLVYMSRASTCVSHSAAAWPDLWLLSLRHIFLPTADSLHGIALGL